MTRIKICGMTNLDDCRAAVDLGVDFIGFVFYRESKRYVTPDTAKEIIEELNGSVGTVGVFVDETARQAEDLTTYCGLDYAQMYNATEASRIADKDRCITVYRIDDEVPPVSGQGLVLFDSHSPGFGGSGLSFNQDLLRGHPVLDRAFVAGGITEENVGKVLRLDPFGIDLVSSVEKEKGKKDHLRMERFVKKVRSFTP